VVLDLPDVVAAAAVGLPDDTVGERLELVVVRRRGSGLLVADVVAHCRRQLSKHMVPEVVRMADALPLNANGKMIKREVRAMCLRLSAGSSGAGECIADADVDDDSVGGVKVG
jgi:acyl-coenzyme A synthetase/AMP-(fatty) acid ligase